MIQDYKSNYGMMAQISDLAVKFNAEATKAGAVVHEVFTKEDILSAILKLAQEQNVKNVVKSNSKLADEIGLRKYLERFNINVIETDFKQWLAQLDEGEQSGRRTVGRLAKLISEVSGQNLVPDQRVLLNAANRIIKQYCVNADMGISEANAAIAETGTLIIMGNEGVSRLVMVLPRIHVTLVEAEDVVPVMEDVLSRIRKTAGGKTSQAVPSYVTYLTGRNTTADIPGAVLARAQGPAEEHVIILNKTTSRSAP